MWLAPEKRLTRSPRRDRVAGKNNSTPRPMPSPHHPSPGHVQTGVEVIRLQLPRAREVDGEGVVPDLALCSTPDLGVGGPDQAWGWHRPGLRGGLSTEISERLTEGVCNEEGCWFRV